MQIDWVTVGAQVVNFLVLVWLLQHFLYRPITRAMAAREQRIQDQIEQAERGLAEADEQRRKLVDERADLEKRREALLAEAQHEVEETRKALEQKMRVEVEADRTAWRSRLTEQQEEFLGDLRQAGAEEIGRAMQAVLADLANSELEERVAAAFTDRLARLDGSELEQLRMAAAKNSVRIESTFDLPPVARGQLTRTVHRVLGHEVEIDYTSGAKQLVCGIRLRAGGRVLQWNLASYLARLEQRLARALEETPRQKAPRVEEPA